MADRPEGYRDTPESDRKKAERFFDVGRSKAQALQYDYAIDMYLQGLALDPEALDAHKELRQFSLERKARGGKDLGMVAKMKLRYGKDDVANMVLAERFLAFDPGNQGRMLELMRYAVDAGCYDTVLWIGPILRKALIDSGKHDFKALIALKDAYIRLRQWQPATDVASEALMMKPDDMNLQQEVKNLSAQQTMDAGRYGQGGSFRDSVKDMGAQQDLMRQDMDIRTVDVLTQQILDARAELQREPNEPGKINKLVEALIKTEQSDYENEAIEILDDAFKRSGQFRFRLRLGQIKMQQMKRMAKVLAEEYKRDLKNPQLRKDYVDFLRDQANEELAEYTLAAENYPTDSSYKFEMAKRLVILNRHTDAIPLLQQSSNDPKIRVDATIELGKAFMAADYLDEAIDTFKGLVESYQITGDAKAKEIYYQYGLALEKRGDKPDAIKCFSTVARWDFNYKDVQERIKRLRSGGAPAAT